MRIGNYTAMPNYAERIAILDEEKRTARLCHAEQVASLLNVVHEDAIEIIKENYPNIDKTDLSEE